jgi:uncharacterized protein
MTEVIHYGIVPEPVRNKLIIAKAIEDYNAGRDGVFSLMEPDLAWTIEGTGIPARRYNSKQAFLEGASVPITSRMRDRMKLTVHGIYADGDHVILNFDGDGVALDGKSFHSAYVWILTMREGRIVKGKAFLDLRAYDRVIIEVQPK